jgi:hypothetical protein
MLDVAVDMCKYLNVPCTHVLHGYIAPSQSPISRQLLGDPQVLNTNEGIALSLEMYLEMIRFGGA